MPLIRCDSCATRYDLPPDVAARLTRALARCRCGALLHNAREILVSRYSEEGDLDQIDVEPFRLEATPEIDEPWIDSADDASGAPRSVQILARGNDRTVRSVFTITDAPLWIGRKGCHVELDDAELSIRHCSIALRGGRLILTDADSHSGTFFDGEPVSTAEITDGPHVIRAGGALISIEPTEEQGEPVRPIELPEEALMSASPELMRKLLDRGARQSSPAGKRRLFLVCLEGPLAGQEFDVTAGEVTVGREGSIRVPDEFLSRKHFTLMLDPDGTLRVLDLGSRNGTFLNSLPARNTRVHGGDEIRAGANRFRVEERIDTA